MLNFFRNGFSYIMSICLPSIFAPAAIFMLIVMKLVNGLTEVLLFTRMAVAVARPTMQLAFVLSNTVFIANPPSYGTMPNGLFPCDHENSHTAPQLHKHCS